MLKTAEALQIKGLSNVRSKRDAKGDIDEGVEDVSDLPSQSVETGGNSTGTGRRSAGNSNASSEASERPSTVPLHRRRKRARTASYETEVSLLNR